MTVGPYRICAVAAIALSVVSSGCAATAHAPDPTHPASPSPPNGWTVGVAQPPVIYFTSQDPSASSLIFNVSNTGHVSSFTLPALHTADFPAASRPRIQTVTSVSSDGGLLLMADDSIIGPNGAREGEIDPKIGFAPIWASTSDSICELTTASYRAGAPVPGTVNLLIVSRTGATEMSAVVGSITRSSYPQLVACDPIAGIAVVETISNATGAAAQVAEIPLRGGSASEPLTIPPPGAAGGVSVAGGFVGAATGQPGGFISPLGSAPKQTPLIANGVSLIGDGQTALEAGTRIEGASTPTNQVSLISWAAGKVLWSTSGPGLKGILGTPSRMMDGSVVFGLGSPAGDQIVEITGGAATVLANNVGLVWGPTPT